MTFKILTINNKTPLEGVNDILKNVSRKLNNCGKIISYSLVNDTKNHFNLRYPGSKHYNPDKVNIGQSTSNSGEAIIDVPGVSRAYHDIDILPRFRKHLTIPINNIARDKKASEFNNTFVTYKKNGKGLIGQVNGSSVTWLYVLSKGVHQFKDSSLMPSDDSLANNIFKRIARKLGIDK